MWPRDREACGGPERRPGRDPDIHSLTLPFSQGPQLIVVKVGVSPNTGTGGEGMSQEPVLAIERVSVSMFCNTQGIGFQLPQLGPETWPHSRPWALSCPDDIRPLPCPVWLFNPGNRASLFLT